MEGTFFTKHMNKELQAYVEQAILPRYEHFDRAHGPGTSHRNHRKIKEFIFLIINYLNISYFLYFCHILPIFRYSVHF